MTIGRPLEFDPEQALEAAMQLFWRKGYACTSLQDLLKAMGLSKSSFYQTFGNKHQLFELCIKRYKNNTLQTMNELLKETQSGREFIEKMLYDITNETRGSNARRGCLIMNTANEFAQQDPVIANLVAQTTNAFVQVFHKAVKQGQQEGDIPAHKDAQALAHFLLSNMSGMKTMVKAGANITSVKEIASVSLTALD